MSTLGDREQIRSQMDLFVKAWETGEDKLLDGCVVTEPYVYFSTHWNCYILDQLKEQLKNAGKKPEFTKIEVANEYSRVKDNEAVQYATIVGCFRDADSHLAFGGTFCNKLMRINGKWMFYQMRFELQTDDAVKEYTLDAEGKVHKTIGTGDIAFIENWQKVNTSVGLFVDKIPGEGKHTLYAECDAPWYLLPENNERSDAEQVKNAFLQYCCAMDLNTPDLLDGVFAPEAKFYSNQAGELNMQDAVNYLTIIRQASARSFHAVRFEKIQVEANRAHLTAVRLSPENAIVSGSSVSCDHGVYDLEYVKHGTAWQISSFRYRIA